MYSALVSAAGYVPLMLTGQDYIALLPAAWRTVNDYGVNLHGRTYDAKGLNPMRRQHSGVTAKRGLWQVRYDPCDLSVVWVADHRRGGFVAAPWTHLPMVAAPFADYTWRHAQHLAARQGTGEQRETATARALADLLVQAGDGPGNEGDRLDRQVAARTRAAAAAHRPPVPVDLAGAPEEDFDAEDEAELGTVIPFGIFDAAAEAETWR